jgi:rhamnose utilization protein RhaD (predicted bifunctional aldolase and dehydrogenase)
MNEYVWASKYLGCRLDLVQAGGGNTSIKLGNILHIKSSGLNLSDISVESGHTTLKLDTLRKKLLDLASSNWKSSEKKVLENIGKELLKDETICDGRASIETFFHAVFKKFTFHTHPTLVNMFVSTDSGFEILKGLFKDAYFCEYKTPGIELFLEMSDFIEEAEASDNTVIVFMKNHGLLVSSDDSKENLRVIDYICQVLAKKSKQDLAVEYGAGELFKVFSRKFNCNDLFFPVANVLLSDTALSFNDLKIKHFSPDIFIYLGDEILKFNSDIDVTHYINEYDLLPVLIKYNGYLYIRGKNYKKVKEIEDVLKFYIDVVNFHKDKDSIKTISKSERDYLSDWDAEKFRRGDI